MTLPLKDITLGLYAYRDSVVHTLDPRTKLLACFMLMAVVLIIESITGLLIFTILLFCMFALSKLSVGIALHNIRTFLWLFTLTIVFHLFFTKGDILFSIPFTTIHAYIPGLRFGVFYSLRLIALILTANLLTLTTAPMEITDGIERMLRVFRKLGVRSHELALMFSISLRFIPLLLEESDRIKKAQMCRGITFRGGLFKRAKQLIPLVIPLFLSAFRRSNDLALAMDARCYRGEGRTQYVLLKFNRQDACAAVIVGGVFMITIISKFSIGG